MPPRPHWTDKFITKASLGAIVRVPGNEVEGGAEDSVARSGPALWMRRYRLTSYVILVVVLPSAAYGIARALGLGGVWLLLVVFAPSIAIARWFVTRR